ncbi:MAG TPA: hypothetical protein PLK15_05405, partial [Chitinophagales bacterium]|nr:hypothetical protein [Chitinophagales bacterium]
KVEISSKKSIEVDRNVDSDKSDTKNLKFTTHTGEEVSGKRLTDTLNKVADDMVESANKKRQEHYADHITEKQKEDILKKDIEYAEGVRKGDNINNFTIQQRINTELTGESIPLFSPEKTDNKNAVSKKETTEQTKQQQFKNELLKRGLPEQGADGSSKLLVKALEDRNTAYNVLDIANKNLRELWSEETGVTLPKTQKGTKGAVDLYFANKNTDPLTVSMKEALKLYDNDAVKLANANWEDLYEKIPEADDEIAKQIIKLTQETLTENKIEWKQEAETNNEEEIVQQLNITKDEAKSAKSASAKRTRKSKSIIEAIEDETKIVTDSGDGKRAKELIETIEIAENAILNNTDTDELFESKHGVSEITLAKSLNAKGRKAKIGEVYEELTGKELVGSGYYAKDEELEQYNIFIKDFLNAIGREGIKLVSPIDIDEKNAMLLESQPQPIKPLKSSGIESLSKIVSGDDLRPALASVFIDGDNYIATDAHKLIVIKRNESDESVIAKMKESLLKRYKKVASDKDAKIAVEKEILKLKDGIDGKLLNLKAGEIVDAKFPDYKAVIPENIKKTKPLDIQTIIDITNGAKNVLRNVSGSKKGMVIPFTGYESINIGVNPEYFLDVLQALQANGAKKITLNIDTVSRAIVIKSDNGDLGLTMPIFLGDLSEIKSEYEMTIIKAPELEISVSKNDAKIMRDNLQKKLDNKSTYHVKEYNKAVKEKDDYSIRYHKPLMLDEVAGMNEKIQKLDEILNEEPLQGKDLIGDALDRIVDKIGG